MFNPMQLTDRLILVTGASSGIGREICILLSRLGARVMLVSRNVEELKKTRSLMEGEGHLLEPFDLLHWQMVPEFMADLVKKTGPLNGLVHSAGVTATLPYRMYSEKNINDIMSVNLHSAITLTQSFCKKKYHVPGSSLVFISSIASMIGRQGNSIYSASKGALNGLMKSLAIEFAADVRINCVAPGYVTTELTANLNDKLTEEGVAAIQAMHPLGIGSPVDVANAVAFLLADTGKWITGTTLVVDGGYTAH